MSISRADSSDRIVISGISLQSPLGLTASETWLRLLAGQTAVRPVKQDAPGWHELGTIAGAPLARTSLPQAPFSEDPSLLVAEQLAHAAWQDAGLADVEVPASRIGCCFGSSKGGLALVGDHFARHSRGQSGAVLPSGYWPHTASSRMAGTLGIGGPVSCPVAACATGLIAALTAAHWLARGDADVVLAGSVDLALQPTVIASFRRLGVLAASTAPEACRPFDRDRDGFVIGEGGACLILERESSARARGIRPYARWLDGMALTDPTHLMRNDASGQALEHGLQQLFPGGTPVPDCVSLHGTATRLNDPLECQTLRRFWGSAADSLLAFSVKGALGHLLGAAGSVELAITAMALRQQIVPATRNCFQRDNDCPLNIVQETPIAKPLQSALKISLGFGGHVALARLEAMEADWS